MATEVRDAFCYCYRLTGDSFRLLEIIPDRDEAPIACKLRQYGWSGRIRRPPPYDTLSYTWGDEVPTKEIICDEEIMLITSNLQQALWRVRQLGETRYLWVDAICINQSDLTEKTTQVRQMIDIYSRSRKVFAWLGEEDSTTESVFRLMREMSIQLSGHRKAKAFENIDLNVGAFGLPPVEDQVWIDLGRILSSSWFQRVWIIQEITVAPTGVFLCGRFQIERSVAFSTAEILARFDNLRHDFKYSLQRIKTSGSNWWTGYNLAVIRNSYVTKQFDLSLDYLIMLTTTFQSSEPRDKIFALVGISRDTPTEFIDYGKDLRSVNIETMKLILSKPHGMDLLSMVSKYRSVDLPSWVPDFSLTHDVYSKIFCPLFRRFPDFRASDVCVRFHQVGNKEDLIVTGKLVDIVDTVIEQTAFYCKLEDILENEDKRMKRGVELYDWIQQCEDMARLEEIYLDGSPMEEAIQRAIFFDKTHPNSSDSQRLHQSYQAWRNVLQISATGDYNRDSHQQRVLNVLLSGRGFRRDVCLAGGAIGFYIGILAGSVLKREMPRSLSQWLRITSTCIVLLVALNVTLLACPHAISKEDEDAEDLDQMVSKLAEETKETDFIMESWPVGRKVFRSTHKAIGWVPEDAQRGDAICLIQGSNIPFVIRKCGGGFQLLGDCYLQSLMTGKAWDFYKGTLQEIRLI